ncbi:MAG: CehA/McbA family metallohydrolase [Phycisphaerae bacterium]|nr:CehA/McbA family metallohydrolase [Phycisphaerae bacterium]
MIYENPFSMPGKFYKGNTHTHSTESDGKQTLKQRFDAYRARGYDFLVMTDHGVVSDVSGFSRDGFLAIPGVELHPGNPYGGETYHFVGIGVSRLVETVGTSANDVLAGINDQGGVAVLAHPYWSGHTITDYAELHGYIGVEVYNTTCYVSIGKGYSESHWDDLLDRAGPTVGLAVDDAHHVSRDAFQGWIMVKARELTTPAILESLRMGAFYSTQGPEIKDMQVAATFLGQCLRVRTTPAQRIAFKGRASCGQCFDAGDGESIEEAECVLEPMWGYLRVEVTDASGKKAWSNPFLVSDYV